MGMALFYVTILRVFFGMEFGVEFCGFAGVFEGGSGKTMVLGWCFGGEFVVDCMAVVVIWRPTFRSRKMRHVLRLYFWLPVTKGFCGK
jgi:hypothetical protein